MILSSLFFVLIMLVLLYWALIPMYCSDLVACRLNSSLSAMAYNWFVGVLLLLMIVSNLLTALQCPSPNKGMNAMYAIFSTLACWALFVFVVFTREYLRMSFANVFGYLWISKKASEVLNVLIPANNVDIAELVNKLQEEKPKDGETFTKYPDNAPLPLQSLLNLLQKTRIDDNFELLTYLRSGDNFVPSLQYVSKYTNKTFSKDIQTVIDGGVERVKENPLLIELLKVLYTRDVIGEVILLVLAGVMSSYLSEYLIKKINCSYKTTAEIEQGLAEYNAQYNQNQDMQDKQIVVTL
jgi:hypothetical protein